MIPNHEIMVRRGIGGTCLQSDARHGAELCVATRRLARPGRAKQNEASRRHNGQVLEFTKMNHSAGPRKDGEWSLGLWRDAVMVLTLERYASESLQVPTHLEMPRESTLGQKAVD